MARSLANAMAENSFFAGAIYFAFGEKLLRTK